MLPTSAADRSFFTAKYLGGRKLRDCRIVQMAYYRNFILLATATVAALAAPTDDLIVPGLRVGPVTRTSTEAALRQSLGKDAVKGDIEIGEGSTEPGLILFNNDPTRRLAVLWNEEKPAHPGAVVICYGEVEKPCKWHTASGITRGTTLKDLERRNGKPFKLTGFGWDLGGNITSFEGGQLERELRPGEGWLGLTLGPSAVTLTEKEGAAIDGDKVLTSTHPVLQKSNPLVVSLTLQFAEPKK